MNKRQTRLALIADILGHNAVGSQDELLKLLADKNCYVTQATLSRDLKTLRTSKVPAEMGGYRYVVSAAPQRRTTETVLEIADDAAHSVVSVNRTSNLVILRTLMGHAPAIARRIDMLGDPAILGTIAGVDTVIVAIDENSTPIEVAMALSRVAPKSTVDVVL